MSKQYSRLESLKVGETVVVYSPIEGEDDLVRTGTMSEGSSFIHAILHAYSRDYISLDTAGRLKFVERVRRSAAKSIDFDRWRASGGADESLESARKEILSTLKEFFRIISNGDEFPSHMKKVVAKIVTDDDDREVYGIIAETLPFEEFERKIWPATSRCTALKDFKARLLASAEAHYISILSDLGDELSPEKLSYLVSRLQDLIIVVQDQTEKSAFKAYIKSMQEDREFMDTALLSHISDKFKRDFYFLDGKRRLPVQIGKKIVKGRKSNILLWVDDTHYEIVGRLLPGSRIQRDFDPEDSLIDRIKTFLYSPEKIPTYYPALVEFLPGNFEKSPSPSPSRSDKSSDSDN